ncbi:hypothetical protein COO60DRAFT_244118 [Scenedesmus sp. NREL 46B-D3]|nr:hypothetical protein COO60DRAFT_244118 [Scenedesmus sp. NREL 46B-D3]
MLSCNSRQLAVQALVAWMQQLLGLRSLIGSGNDVAVPAGCTAAKLWADGLFLLGNAAVVATPQDGDSAAADAVAANMTQQLDQSGWLSSLSAGLPALAQLASQQLTAQPAGSSGWTPLAHLLGVLQRLLSCWYGCIRGVPALVPTVVNTLLPLAQQLQSFSAQLPGPAAGVAASTAAGPGAEAGSHSCRLALRSAVLEVHVIASMLACVVVSVLGAAKGQAGAGVAVGLLRLQHEPAVAALQLQALAAWTAQLHQHHVAQQQQQQQQQQPPSSSRCMQTTSPPIITACCSCCQVARPTWMQQLVGS